MIKMQKYSVIWRTEGISALAGKRRVVNGFYNKAFFIIFIQLIILYVIYQHYNDIENSGIRRNEIYEISFSGQVTSKFVRNGRVIINLEGASRLYSLSSKFNNDLTPRSLEKYLQIGMKVSKNKNSDTLYVYNLNSNHRVFFILYKN